MVPLPPWLACGLLSPIMSFAVAQVPPHATLLNPTLATGYPIVVHDGDDVHAIASGSGTLLHARSRDGGRTWPLREVPLGPFATALSTTFAVDVAGPGQLLAVGLDLFAGPTLWRSTDHGTTWASGMPLFATPTTGIGGIALLANGPNVTVAWLRSNVGELVCRTSTDGGATWLPINTLVAPGPNSSSDRLHAFRNGNTIDLLWNSFLDAWHQRSTDGGATWLPAPALVPGGAVQVASSDGTNLLVATSSGIVRSSNGGATWVMHSIPGVPFPSAMAREGALLAVLGTTTQPSFGAITYAVRVSIDSGQAWVGNALTLPSPVNYNSQVLVEAGSVYVRFWPGDALNVVTSHNAGASWQLVLGPVSGGLSPGSDRNVHIVRGTNPSTLGTGYYAYAGIGSTTLGIATAGNGGITPRLRALGLPFQGTTTTLQVSGAVGGSAGGLAVSFAPPAPLPLGSAIVWPTTAPLLFVFATSGAVGAPGAGTFQLPVAIPLNPFLAGMSFTSQGLVLDGANPDGFVVSNALETWLR